MLNFLIVDSSNDLRDAISGLDPFPDTAKFKQINRCSRDAVKDRTSLAEVRGLNHKVFEFCSSLDFFAGFSVTA